MKINSTIHVSVFLMAMLLIFNVPCITFAQQNDDRVLAIFDAKRDAEADVNKLLWGAVGCVAVPACTILGFIGGAVVGGQNSSGGYGLSLSPEAARGGLIGSGVGCLLPFIPISAYKSGPPPERLIGKSPEYVKLYTDTYKSKVRQLRIVSAGAGGALGCLLVFASIRDW